ncbi:MAG: ATP synthase F1 subunit delta [Verrucomicrobiaceae bacterium]|nr:ATP synthase F1 subunit delta [Verrucomicrobiaceae bacterium]
MKISKEARRTSRQLFRACFADGKLDEARARSVVALVTEKKPRGYIGILENFARLLRGESERQNAVVESATAISDDMRFQLKAGLAKKYGRELALQFQVVPELLGGIRVKVGSDVWDGSVKARLEALKNQLA